MDRLNHRCSASAVVALILAGLLACVPSLPASNSSAFTGNARAVQATSLASDGTSTTTIVADTGPLAGANDARDASQPTASAPSLMDADDPSSATISWDNEVDSSSSVTNLNVTAGGVVITANSVLSMASVVSGPHGSNTGVTLIDGLAVNGNPVTITGNANQIVPIPGGHMTINETKSTGKSVSVNALHIVMNGAADVVIASSTASVS
jgi:hypothetical protein